MSYVELQLKTNFSFLHGASHPEELMEQAARLGYKALGVCDYNTLAGVVRADVTAKKFGITPVIGSELKLHEHSPLPYTLICYPQSRQGYASLSRLLTKGRSRAAKGECLLYLEDILSDIRECSVIVSGECKDLLVLREHFGRDNLSVAVSNTYISSIEAQLSQARKAFLPIVATNNVLFHTPQRKPLHDIVTCIREGETIDRIGYRLEQNAERYLKPPDEISRIFRHYPEAIRRSCYITEQCSGFSLSQLRYEYPKEVCPEGLSPVQYLKQLTWQGARERYPRGVPEKVVRQLEHECRLIEELNYAKYFLTVYDIVRFAVSQGILCQGRGAAANSAVCYCLGITAVDPDRINLLFERFISKERNEPPDIDIDFEHERREEIIQYIYNTYGRERAALVCEVVSYRTKSAVRETGKALGLPLEDVERLLKLLNQDEEEELARVLKENRLSARELHTLRLSQELIGFPRHLSQHVGGFVISDPPLSELVPIENAQMEGRTVIEWDKDDIEAMGMLKIDCLALGMLSCIRKALNLIGGVKLYEVPAEDSAVYDMICKADTIGVFQIESRAQMTMLPRLKPRCFYDLVIEVAIVRPGPIQGGMVHPYLRRRSGKERPYYPTKAIEQVLGKTLGVPIFQEQAMELAIVAAGFTPGEADELRRAMASWKKDKNALIRFQQRITTGMISQGYTEEFAKQCFQQIRGFGEYGFPQSHAASFAHLVYVSAWLKRHYPAEFCISLLNSQPMGFYHPAQLLQDASRHGVEIRGVDINHSHWDCTLEGRAVRVGMRLVRGLEKSEAMEIVRLVRQHGPFKSISSLWRVGKIKKSALAALAKADAFSSMGLSRQQALWELKRFRDHALPLLEAIEAVREPKPALPEISAEEEVARDYHHLSYSLKAHPLSFYRENLQGVLTTKELNTTARHNQQISVAGIILIRQRPPTASGFVFLTIEDEHGTANLIVKPDIYKRFRQTINDSVYLLTKGRVQRSDGVVHLIVEEIRKFPVGNFREVSGGIRDYR